MAVFRFFLSLVVALAFAWTGLWLISAVESGAPDRLQLVGLTLLLSAPVWGILVYMVVARVQRVAVQDARR